MLVMWPPGHSFGANAAMQVFDRDKAPPTGLARASPSAGLPEVRGGCLVRWGPALQRLQGGWRAIVTQDARIARRSGRLLFRISN